MVFLKASDGAKGIVGQNKRGLQMLQSCRSYVGISCVNYGQSQLMSGRDPLNAW